MNSYEKTLIENAISNAGNASEAARNLRIDKSTMSGKLRKYETEKSNVALLQPVLQ